MVICHAHFPNIRRWQGTNEDFADIQVVFDVNVKSYIHIATNTLRYLQASNGSLGILGSIAGKKQGPSNSQRGNQLEWNMCDLKLAVILDGVHSSLNTV